VSAVQELGLLQGQTGKSSVDKEIDSRGKMSLSKRKHHHHHHHRHHWHDSPGLPHFWISEQFSFYGVRLSGSRPTPNLEDQCIPLRLAPTPRPVRWVISSYATAGIALRVSGALKPHHRWGVNVSIGVNISSFCYVIYCG
jgi:hypothetical protein